MISNGHQIDNVHKKKDIDLILNKNQSVFECPKAIYPDIRLEYIANGPDASSDIQPDVYFSLPIPEYNNRAQSIEMRFSMENFASTQWIYGSTSNPIYEEEDGMRYYKVSGVGIVTSNIIPTERYLTPSSISDSSTWMRYSSGIMTGKYDSSGNYIGPLSSSNNILSAGQAVSTPLASGIHTMNVGDKNTFVYDGATSSNPSANSAIGSVPMYVFRANATFGKCYSGTKIYYIKHYIRATYNVYNEQTLCAYYIPVLHWDTDSSTYKPCFYDKVNNVYSSYNLGSDVPRYVSTGDKILDYISKGVATNLVSFDTGLNARIDDNVLTTYEFGYSSSVHYKSGYPQILFGYKNPSRFMYFSKAESSSSGPKFYFGNSVTFNKITDSSLHNVEYSLDMRKMSSASPSASYPYVIFDSSTKYADAEYGNLPTENTLNNNIRLFTYYDSAASSYISNEDIGSRIHYFNVSKLDNSKPVACMIPVLHDGVPCFYDLKRNTYHYNSWSGTPYYKFIGVAE